MASKEAEMKLKIRVDWLTQQLKEQPDEDLKKAAYELAVKFNCSPRTAKDYIKMALWRIENGV